MRAAAMSEDDIVYFHRPEPTIDPVVEHVRAWLQHALEECLDQAVYLRRAIWELDKEADDGR